MVALFYSSLVFSSTTKLLTTLLSKNIDELDTLFIKTAINADPAKKLKYSINVALDALDWKKAGMSEDDVIGFLRLIAKTDDSALVKNLDNLLQMDVDKMTQKDMVDAINHLFYVAEYYGKKGAYLMHCTSCTDLGLEQLGVKYLLRAPKKGTTAYKLMDRIPTSPKRINGYLIDNFKKLKFGDFTKESAGKVSIGEKKALALFIGTLEEGTPKEKELAKKILKFNSADGGKIDLLGQNKMWKIFESLSDPDLVPQERVGLIDDFSRMLDDVISSSEGRLNRKEFLQKKLEQSAREKGLLQEFETFKKLNCWGLF